MPHTVPVGGHVNSWRRAAGCRRWVERDVVEVAASRGWDRGCRDRSPGRSAVGGVLQTSTRPDPDDVRISRINRQLVVEVALLAGRVVRRIRHRSKGANLRPSPALI